MDFVWKGHIIDSLDRHSLRVRENGYLVCQEGRCAGVFDVLPEQYRNLPFVGILSPKVYNKEGE